MPLRWYHRCAPADTRGAEGRYNQYTHILEKEQVSLFIFSSGAQWLSFPFRRCPPLARVSCVSGCASHQSQPSTHTQAQRRTANTADRHESTNILLLARSHHFALACDPCSFSSFSSSRWNTSLSLVKYVHAAKPLERLCRWATSPHTWRFLLRPTTRHHTDRATVLSLVSWYC